MFKKIISYFSSKNLSQGYTIEGQIKIDKISHEKGKEDENLWICPHHGNQFSSVAFKVSYKDFIIRYYCFKCLIKFFDEKLHIMNKPIENYKE